MNIFSNQTYRMAFQKWWKLSYHSQEVDMRIAAFTTSDIQPFKNGESWLRGAREASLISTGQAAQRMGISRSGFHGFEVREEKGTITLRALAKAAEALDCELVYAIRPKKKERFSVLIWKALVAEAQKQKWIHSRPAKAQANALATKAMSLFEDAEFRKQQGWSERRQPSERLPGRS